MRFLGLLLAIFVLLPADPSAADELKKVVVLSRHGVRAPTQDARLLSMWSQKPWPEWPVARGELTPRGARLVSAMWANLKTDLQKKGLLPADACPDQSAIFVRADVDERTKATAAAILDGLAPACGLGYAVSDMEIDPLFHPVRAGLYHYDAITAATAVLSMTHGGLERLQDEFSGALTLMGRISGPPAANLCSRFALMPRCQLEDLPNAISVSPDGSTIRILGGLGVASSMAEIFLLEYGEWPNTPAGWGEVDARVLGQLLPVHSRIFDIVNRAPVVSWANGSSLLMEMTAALSGRHYDRRANEAKLVVFVGHDTNIANVGALLEFYWDAAGYPPNGIPPAGAIFLELWERQGRQEVVARFYSQPPKALHMAFRQGDGNNEINIADHAPGVVPVEAGAPGKPVALTPQALDSTVLKVTKGAPMAPAQEPPYEYGMAN